jgi:hypothetical protein
MTSAPTLSPLSPPVTTTILSSGGTAANPPRADALPSPTANSVSPSQAAPSTAGGGGGGMAECMGFWDKSTHMSKGEWREACQRTVNRLAQIAAAIPAAEKRLQEQTGVALRRTQDVAHRK